MGGVWRMLKQLMSKPNAQVSNGVNVLGIGKIEVIPVLRLKLDI